MNGWRLIVFVGGYEPEAPLRSEIAFINFQLIPPTPFAFLLSIGQPARERDERQLYRKV